MYKQYGTIEANNESFWSDHWKTQNTNQQMSSAKNSELIPIFKKYLPKHGKILEAGCGQGAYVNALKELGYDIEGIDFDSKTIENSKKIFPELPIKVGDVFKTNFPNNYLHAYISLGVIEHYESNFENPIKEAGRILRQDGLIMISVPYFNIFRKIYLPIRNLFVKKQQKKFYQYLFTKNEIEKLIKNNGFSIVGKEFYGKTKTLLSLPIIGNIIRKMYNYSRETSSYKTTSNTKHISKIAGIAKTLLNFLPNSVFAHMIMIIAKKQ